MKATLQKIKALNLSPFQVGLVSSVLATLPLLSILTPAYGIYMLTQNQQIESNVEKDTNSKSFKVALVVLLWLASTMHSKSLLAMIVTLFITYFAVSGKSFSLVSTTEFLNTLFEEIKQELPIINEKLISYSNQFKTKIVNVRLQLTEVLDNLKKKEILTQSQSTNTFNEKRKEEIVSNPETITHIIEEEVVDKEKAKEVVSKPLEQNTK
jgi:hypothetical protein